MRADALTMSLLYDYYGELLTEKQRQLVLAAAETAGSSTLNLSDNTVYTYSTQSVTSDSVS